MRKNTAALIDGKSLMSENELSQLTLDNLYHAIFYTINNTIRIIYPPAPISCQIDIIKIR